MLTINVALKSYLKSRVSEPKLSGSASILLNPPFDIELHTVPNIHLYKLVITNAILK